jgi:type II secretory pathway component HofQ
MRKALRLVALLTVAAAAAAASTPDEETRITIDVKEASIQDVIALLSEVGGFQVVMDPGVNCRLTLKLKEVRWPKILEVALRSCNLGQEEDDGIVRIAPVARFTEEAQAQARYEEARAQARPRTVTRVRLSYARAESLAPIIKKMLSARGEVVVDARTNTLIIID